MEQAINMTQKSEYQLRWIIENKNTYSGNQIKAALVELKKRELVNTETDDIMDYFNQLWNSIYRFFK